MPEESRKGPLCERNCKFMEMYAYFSFMANIDDCYKNSTDKEVGTAMRIMLVKIAC